MASWNLGSVATRAYQHIEDVPTTISGTVMQNFADDARKLLQNYTGSTISSTTIPEKYQTVLVNLCVAYTVGRMEGIGVDFDWSLAEFKVSKSGKESSRGKQMDFHLSLVNNDLKSFGRRAQHKKVNG